MQTRRRLLFFGSAVALLATLGRCSDNNSPNTPFDLAASVDLSATGDLATAPADLSRLPTPTITAISPAIGVDTGGTALTITGTGFQSPATVTVAGVPCVNPTVVSPTSITCTTAAKVATCGQVAVVVQNPDAQTATDNQDFSLRGKALALGAATDYAMGTSPQFLSVADVDGNGTLDLLAANAGANTLSLRLGKGDGTFFAPIDLTISPNGAATAATIATADLNGDKKLDIVVTLPAQGQISVLLGNGNGTFATAVQYAAGSQAFGVALGDVTGDQFPDVIVTNNVSTGTIGVLTGDGTGKFGAPASRTVSGANPTYVVAYDLNGDKSLDLITANSTSGTVSVMAGAGNGTFGTPTTYAMGPGSNFVAVADAKAKHKLWLRARTQTPGDLLAPRRSHLPARFPLFC